ncbi:T9SS type A sorting domain-containing protein, partial [bacterium]|nr:T9SS type A sorting domain-containing protein [bacterium]
FEKVVTISTENPEMQKLHFRLFQNYPNPFNPSTKIDYKIKETGNKSPMGKLLIFNVLSEVVREFELTENEGSILWNGTDKNGKQVSSGIYFYRLESGSFHKTKKMVLMK